VEVLLQEGPLGEAGADLAAFALHEGDELPAELAAAAGAEDARAGFRKLALLHPGGQPHVLAIGLGAREEADAERLRVAAALAAREAGRLEARSLAWQPPDSLPAEAAVEAIVTGTILAGYRFDRYITAEEDEEAPRPPEQLILLGDPGLAGVAERARVGAAAQNRARELQNLPANVATPAFLAQRAEEIAAGHEALSAEVLGPAEIASRGMGGLEAVARGSHQEPRLIVLRYGGGGDAGPLGLVGKGVTFDSGGISLKPGQSMHEMKMDMSGAAAVLESVAALAELEAPLNVIAVVPATENMPGGQATRPGDIITQYSGKTVEVNNTDAEGRLILADALAYAVEQGADPLIDIATLTGAVLVALGSTYAGLVSNDDALAEAVERAGAETGELAWRLPLHPEYRELTKGTAADLANVAPKRKAGTLYAAAFLEEFVGEARWAHLDIAGVSWDVGREYVGNGATGYGVRLILALARELQGRPLQTGA
jgi:leucyl aminopeptidase